MDSPGVTFIAGSCYILDCNTENKFMKIILVPINSQMIGIMSGVD